MIEIMDPPAPHVVHLRSEGKIEAPDIDRAIEAIDATLAAHDRIGFIGEMPEFKGMTVEALARDIKYVLGKLGQIRRFERCAVITDTSWVANMARFENWFIPFVEIRAFGTEERQAALDWVAGAAGGAPAGTAAPKKAKTEAGAKAGASAEAESEPERAE